VKDTRGRLLSQAGIVGLLAAYACFAWPGLYHLAAHVLDVREQFTAFGWSVQRAWLYPAAVDGGIFVAGCILLTHPELKKRTQLWRELWFGMWTVAALSGAGLVADELSRLSDRSWGWLPIPLILAPVVIATWFLHMVVRVQGEAPMDADVDPSHREEVTNADGSGDSVPVRNPDPSAPDDTPDDSDMAGVTALTVGDSNGDGMSLRAQAEKAAKDYLAKHGELPTEKELTAMGQGRWKRGTAYNALAPLRKG